MDEQPSSQITTLQPPSTFAEAATVPQASRDPYSPAARRSWLLWVRMIIAALLPPLVLRVSWSELPLLGSFLGSFLVLLVAFVGQVLLLGLSRRQAESFFSISVGVSVAIVVVGSMVAGVGLILSVCVLQMPPVFCAVAMAALGGGLLGYLPLKVANSQHTVPAWLRVRWMWLTVVTWSVFSIILLYPHLWSTRCDL